MSREELGRLADAGWEIGSHSRTHPRLIELDDAALEQELRGSREDCERLMAAPCLSIAYPYGATDPRVQRAAAEAGFAAGAALPAGPLEFSRFAWPRIGIYRADSQRRFELKIAPAVRALRRTRLWNLRRSATRVGRARS
jgi:peptidoglycan/xylan/chitin deacetylase (PgdA/CDA1 family)